MCVGEYLEGRGNPCGCMDALTGVGGVDATIILHNISANTKDCATDRYLEFDTRPTNSIYGSLRI